MAGWPSHVYDNVIIYVELIIKMVEMNQLERTKEY